ncbi:MAG: helix-turn-helix domain-containing protein [Lachnospiraceae bacterium]|nr:helix-turn-helix domain-containing protein [Lachnospiraceae bacterium]
MIKLQIGQMLYDIRTEMEITQEELCEGLCTVSALSKYENGTRFPDSLLFHALMQRLGKSPSRINIMVSEQEAVYYEWKKKTLDAIKAQRWEEVKALREKGHEENALINESLQRQFELYLDSIIWDKLHHNQEKSYECIGEAIHLTMPDIDSWDGKRKLISGDEMNMAFLYLRAEKKLGIKSDAELKKQFDAFTRYVNQRVDDVFEKAKLYPRLVCAQIYLVDMDVRERIFLEKKALSLLKQTREIYDMPEVLRLLVKDLRSVGAEDVVIYEKQRAALVEVINEFGTPYTFRLENWYDSNEQICLMNEYLRAARMQKQMTQEELSEGICAVETYSRIESGKRSPSKRNYLELAEKLEVNWGYYRGQIVTTHFRDFEIMTKQRFAMLDDRLEESEEYLYDLKKSLDMEDIENRQYIGLQELILTDQRGEIVGEAFVERCEELLKYTLEDWRETERFLTKTELELIFQMGWYYESKKEYGKVVYILENALRKYETRKYSSWYEIGLMKRMLAGGYSDLGEYEKSNEMMNALIREMLNWQDGQALAEAVYLLGWNYENQKKACDDLYVKAFYLSDLFENHMHHAIFQKYYEDNFNSEMQWY